MTRNRLFAVVALPASLALLGACGTPAGPTTGTTTGSVVTTTVSPATTSPTMTDTASSTGDQTGTATGTGTGTGTATGTGAGGGSVPTTFTAAGTEPFWDIEVTGTTLRYTPDPGPDTETEVMEGERSTSGNAVIYTGIHEGNAFRLAVTPRPCNDGMSDTEHPYEVRWTYGTQTFEGCARD